MKHKHVTTCEHDIKVCDCCDTAYCTKCDKEWASEKVCTLPHYPTYIPYYQPPPLFPTWRPYWQVWGTANTTPSQFGGNVWASPPAMGGNSMMQLGTGADIR